MQIAVIEFARNVLKLEKANSTEIDPQTPDPVIDLMEDQKGVADKGASMRLGAQPCNIAEGTASLEAYGVNQVYERHRHRFEFNNGYQESFERKGLKVAGVNPERNLVEIIEVVDHPWFVAVQFHPKFQSKPNQAHPLFAHFIKASMKLKR